MVGCCLGRGWGSRWTWGPSRERAEGVSPLYPAPPPHSFHSAGLWRGGTRRGRWGAVRVGPGEFPTGRRGHREGGELSGQGFGLPVRSVAPLSQVEAVGQVCGAGLWDRPRIRGVLISR